MDRNAKLVTSCDRNTMFCEPLHVGHPKRKLNNILEKMMGKIDNLQIDRVEADFMQRKDEN